MYLATGESEQDFAYAADLVSFDADVILCVWGAPGLGGAEQGDLRCEVECTGDARKVCRDVCRGASPGSARRLKGEGGGGGGGMGEVHYLYVGNSSFQQGRNHLYLEAQRLGNYAYFIFLVDDLSVVQVDFGTGMLAENAYRTLEQYLVTWQPALAVSGAARRDDDFHIDPRAEVPSACGSSVGGGSWHASVLVVILLMLPFCRSRARPLLPINSRPTRRRRRRRPSSYTLALSPEGDERVWLRPSVDGGAHGRRRRSAPVLAGTRRRLVVVQRVCRQPCCGRPVWASLRCAISCCLCRDLPAWLCTLPTRLLVLCACEL